MYSFQSIKIENLFSYEKAEIQFQNNELTLIYGVNHDSPGRSNGSGKSSILDCVALSIIGSPLKKLNKTDLVRNNQSSGYIECILTNPILNKELKICRWFFLTKTNKIELYEDGVLNTQLKDLNPKETEKYLGDLIGISETDLLNYFLISKEKYESLFLSNDSTKKAIINRFSKADTIDYIEPLLKTEIDKFEKNIVKIDQDIISYQSKIELLQQQIEQENNINIEGDRKKEIDSIQLLIDKCGEEKAKISVESVQSGELERVCKTQLAELDDSVESEQKTKIEAELISLREEVKLKRQEYLQVPKNYNDKIETITLEITKRASQQGVKKHELREIDQFIGEIEKNLADSIECPKCRHIFILRDKDYDIEEAKKILPQVKEQKIQVSKVISELEENIKIMESQIQEVKKNITVEQAKIESKGALLNLSITKKEDELKLINKAINEISVQKDKLSNQIKQYETKIKSLEDSLKFQQDQEKKYLQGIEDLKSKVYESKVGDLRKNKIELQQQITLVNVDKDNIDRELSLHLKWQNHFKRFKSFLANKSIRLIQDYSNHFLQQIKSDLKVSIDGFKELSNGKLKEEITILVSRDGLTTENFAKFSGGQKAEVDLSCITAMQEIINMNCDYGKGLNFIGIDEVLESLDAVGLQNIVKALKGVEKTLLLITHVDPDKQFDCNKIVVEYENKISSIK